MLGILTQTQKANRSYFSFSTFHLNLSIMAMIVILSVIYLISLNSLTTKGYEIRKLEQKILQLETEHKRLEVQASNLQSISKVQLDAQSLNFVPANDVIYIKAPDYALK